VPNEFVIGYVLLTLLIKRLAVAMVNKTVGMCRQKGLHLRSDSGKGCANPDFQFDMGCTIHTNYFEMGYITGQFILGQGIVY
jgi:hypothetical protein